MGWLIEAVHAGSLDDQIHKVGQAIRSKFGKDSDDFGTWAVAVFDSYVIFRQGMEENLFWVDYSINSDDEVVFAEAAVPARQIPASYEKVSEASHGDGWVMAPTGDDGRLLEASDKAALTGREWKVAIIQEGLSKNRSLYTRAVLAEAAPLYEGVDMFRNHEEVARRFGRDIDDKVGFIKGVQAAVFMPDLAAVHRKKKKKPQHVMEATKLGTFLQKTRKTKKLTADAVAKAGGISTSTLSQIERGEIERPPDARLRGFARVLGVSMATLVKLLPSSKREAVDGDATWTTALKEAEAEQGIFTLTATACIVDPDIRARMCEAFEMGHPSFYELSHDAEAKVVTAIHEDRKPFYDVQSIRRVLSVDLVTEASAGGRTIRLAASNHTTTLEGDGAMLERLIAAIQKKGSATQIAALEALGSTPTETQVMDLYESFFGDPAGAPAEPGSGDPAAPAAGDPTPAAAAAAPASPASPAAAEPRVIESVRAADAARMDTLEKTVFTATQRGLTHFVESTVQGTALPDLVKKDLQARLGGSVKEATTEAGLLTEGQVLSAVKEQVTLWGALADADVVQPAAGTQRGVEMGDGPLEKAKEAFDNFFDPTKTAVSIRHLYVEVTGDRDVTGQLKEATRLTEALTTTDFDQILGDSITRRMLAEYRNLPNLNNWKGVVADVVPVSDFRTQRRLRFGGYGNLPIVGQGGAYAALASPTDEEATYSPAKRGGTEQVTLEMIINDDVSAVRRIPTRLARAAAQTLHEFVWDFLRLNSAIFDAVALAAAGHGNNIITTAFSSTNLTLARQRMVQQTDMSSGKRLGIEARVLVVPTDTEEIAFQTTMAVKAVPDTSLAGSAEPAAPNFAQKLGIRYITIPYWTDANDWWVLGDPSAVPMIEIGFLNGREEPELFVQDSPTSGSMFSNDVLTWKIKHTYGGAPMDFRGFVGGIVS